jgi:S1-C subfamily serine protease
VDEAVKAGLGYFLQKVDLQAQLRVDDLGQQRFVGFQITAMRPAREWLTFDFAPGDVITHINGTSVEHYDAVLPLFDGLVNANAFEVRVLRGTETVTVTVRIEPRNSAASAPDRAVNKTSPVGTVAPSVRQ